MTGSHVAFGDLRSGRARVTFTEVRSADDPLLRAWTRFRDTFPTPLATAAAVRQRNVSPIRPTSAVAPERLPALWRIHATNNRELGRSFVLYSSFEAARDHVLRLQERTAELEIAVIAGPLNASRGWAVLLDDAPVMTCSRWYSSASTGIAAAAGALAAMPRAVLSDQADRSAPSGRFSRRMLV